MYRQGDVLVIPVKSIPKEAATQVPSEKGRVVLAHGEATGHHHSLLDRHVVMFRDDGMARAFIKVEKDTPLEHQEHDPINIPKGTYEVRRQVEADPFTQQARAVAD